LEAKYTLDRSEKTLAIVQEGFDALYRHLGLSLSDPEREQLYQTVLDDLVGYGPIEPLLRDDSVTEVMVNGPRSVYVERNGKVQLSEAQFDDNDHVVRIIKKIIKPLGRQVDRRWPLVDARLPDGSRVNAVIPPCAIDGPSITIRKFGKDKLTVEDLIKYGSLTPQMSEFLEACVASRLNIVVSGGTGSGKTTLLNVLSGFIPADERIVTIEDAAELQLHQDHVVRLETKPPEPDDPGGRPVHIRDLVINSLRMRPERIIVGECRGGEALDMLQAMNTGHDGSLTTVHANTPRDTISRLETLVLMAGMDLPVTVVRKQIVSAINLIVQQARLRDGSRKVVNVTEVQGLEGETVILQDIFIFDEQGEEDGKVIGRLRPVGIRPSFVDILTNHGFKLPPSVFMDPQSNAFRRRR
jgi:pilus assembly protein CpaF